MFIFLPDSPVTARGLTKRERRIAVDRLRENQTGVENKHLKPYQILEAFMDYKLYMFFILGVVCMLKTTLIRCAVTKNSRQRPERRDLQLWNHHYQGIRIFYSCHNIDAGQFAFLFHPFSALTDDVFRFPTVYSSHCPYWHASI